MLFVVFFLSGCVRQEYTVTIGESNNVEFLVKVLIDKESYNLMATFGVDVNELEENKQTDVGAVSDVNALFQETAKLFSNLGFEVTSVNDAVELGFTAHKKYLTIEEFNHEIEQMVQNNLCGLNLDIQYVDQQNHKEYKAYGTLNYVLDPDFGFDDPTIKKYFDEQYDPSNMTVTATINMPPTTPITKHDGSSYNGGVQWKTSYIEGEKPVHVISEFHDNTMLYAIGLAFILVAGIAGFFIIRALKFKKEKENSALSEEYEEERKQQSEKRSRRK